jgi:hypothetical protein
MILGPTPYMWSGAEAAQYFRGEFSLEATLGGRSADMIAVRVCGPTALPFFRLFLPETACWGWTEDHPHPELYAFYRVRRFVSSAVFVDPAQVDVLVWLLGGGERVVLPPSRLHGGGRVVWKSLGDPKWLKAGVSEHSLASLAAALLLARHWPGGEHSPALARDLAQFLVADHWSAGGRNSC